jgi:ATP-binding cassette subfamily B protein
MSEGHNEEIIIKISMQYYLVRSRYDMLKLAKYLKPFIGLIIAAVILLFVQAMSDLALPDYMSNIVNKGIQQGGIVNAVPNAIRESQMNRLNIFMNEADKSEIMKNYTLIDKSNGEYDKYVKDYPVLEPSFRARITALDTVVTGFDRL